MAPRWGRKRLTTAAAPSAPMPTPTPPTPPTLTDSSPSMPSSDASVASSSSRRGRGPTRGVGLEKIVRRAGRLHVDIPSNKGSPVGENVEKFVSELGFIVRTLVIVIFLNKPYM
ncbi:hypothetical protein COCNU_scaffold000481G000040 [Cocos nucifera]|nr:hypothetical protein [Cocos nucifera]